MTEAVADLERFGFDGQFRAVAGGDIQCLSCRNSFHASRVDADDLKRLEGASDPGDSAVVIAVVCPECGAHGSLTLQYGPAASVEESDVMAALSRSARAGSISAEATS